MEAGVWVIYEEQGIRHGPERGMCTVMNTLGNRRLGGGELVVSERSTRCPQ